MSSLLRTRKQPKKVKQKSEVPIKQQIREDHDHTDHKRLAPLEICSSSEYCKLPMIEGSMYCYFHWKESIGQEEI